MEYESRGVSNDKFVGLKSKMNQYIKKIMG